MTGRAARCKSRLEKFQHQQRKPGQGQHEVGQGIGTRSFDGRRKMKGRGKSGGRAGRACTRSSPTEENALSGHEAGADQWPAVAIARKSLQASQPLGSS